MGAQDVEVQYRTFLLSGSYLAGAQPPHPIIAGVCFSDFALTVQAFGKRSFHTAVRIAVKHIQPPIERTPQIPVEGYAQKWRLS